MASRLRVFCASNSTLIRSLARPLPFASGISVLQPAAAAVAATAAAEAAAMAPARRLGKRTDKQQAGGGGEMQRRCPKA